MSPPVLEIVNPGLGVSLQDRGRRGWKRYGVPPGGAMDEHAADWANTLLGNDPDAPVLELMLQGAHLRILARAGFALTGADASANHPLWRTIELEADAELRFPRNAAGVWTYLAVRGGFVAQRWFGSVSAFPRGGIGQPLQAGSVLAMDPERAPPPAIGIGARWVDVGEQRDYLHLPVLRVWPGPQWTLFAPADRRHFFATAWRVSARSDRTGYRLIGPALARRDEGILSEPVLVGSIQIPPAGEPIVTMRDGPTVGGYPKLGVLAPADVNWLAQCRPGQQLRFGSIKAIP